MNEASKLIQWRNALKSDDYFSTESEQVLTTEFAPQAETLKTSLEIAKLDIVEALSGLRRNIVPNGNAPLSRVELSASYLHFVIDHSLLKTAEQMYLDKKLDRFIFYYELSYGVNWIYSDIVMAETKIRGLLGNILATTVSDVSQLSKSQQNSGEQTQLWLETMNTAQANSELLMQDNSGFILVDHSVEELTKRGLHRPALRFRNVGASTARDCYKLLYPLTDNL